MILSSHPRAIRAAGATLALVVGMALTPGRAAATCGDYVVIAGPAQLGHNEHHSPATNSGEAPIIPDLPHVPCHGPSCSKSPPDSIPPITAPTGGESDPKGPVAPLAGDGFAGLGMSWDCSLISFGRTIHLPDPIFHPPRVG